MFATELCGIPQEDELVSLAAMHYYVQFGPAYNRGDVRRAVEECIADELIEGTGVTRWIDLVGSAHFQVGCSPRCSFR